MSHKDRVDIKSMVKEDTNDSLDALWESIKKYCCEDVTIDVRVLSGVAQYIEKVEVEARIKQLEWADTITMGRNTMFKTKITELKGGSDGMEERIR